MEVSETPTNNLQKVLIEEKDKDYNESDDDDLCATLPLKRMERVNSAPHQTKVKIVDPHEVKVVIMEDDNSEQMNGNAKRANDSNRGKQFQSVNPNCGRQFRSILKSSRHNNNNDDSFLVRIDASGNEIKGKKKGEKPLHKITFNQQIEEVNVVENWKQYNTDVTSEPGCGCHLI